MRTKTDENSKNKGNREDRYKEMVRCKRILRYVEKVEGTGVEREILGAKDKRFKSSFKGKIVVAAILNNRYRSNIKEVNVNKIMNFLVKKEIKVLRERVLAKLN